MRAILFFLPVALMAQAPAPKPAMSESDSIIYSLGLSINRSLSQFDLSPAELQVVIKALNDAAAGKPAVDLDEWGPKIQGLATERASKVAEREKTASAG